MVGFLRCVGRLCTRAAGWLALALARYDAMVEPNRLHVVVMDAYLEGYKNIFEYSAGIWNIRKGTIAIFLI